MVPADKVANNVVVILRLNYFNTLKQELSATKACEEISEDEKSLVFGNCNDVALKLSGNVKEQQDKLPTMYWLPKLHKRPYERVGRKTDLLLIQVPAPLLNFPNY